MQPLRYLIAALAVLLCGPALAQERPVTSNVVKLGEFIRTPGHLEAVRAALLAFEPAALQAACKDIRVTRARSWRPVDEEPSFDGASASPRNAVWQEVWEVDACGRPGIRNIGFVARPGQGVTPIPMFPGESLAELRTQVAAGQQALGVAASAALQCQERDRIQVINSAVTNRAEFGRGRWSERWTVAGCGRTADLDVNFTPGQQGRPNYEFKTSPRR
jgi:hypothetical protein